LHLYKTILLAILFLFAPTSGFSEQPKVQLTGIFSSFEYGDESGDLGGYEIFVIYSNGHWVLYQEAFGEPSTPSLVKAKIDGLNIEFTVADLQGHKKTFKGKISKTHLIGKFDNGDQLKLPRKKSYWQ